MNVKTIVRTAIIAAMYAALTLVLLPLAYGDVQFRISEVLVLLCFYRKDYRWGLILGCFVANLFSPFPLDIVFGTLATAISVLCISNSKNLIIASLYPVIFNGIIVGLQISILSNLSILLTIAQVAIGELVVVSILGVALFKTLEKNRPFMQLIEANQNF